MSSHKKSLLATPDVENKFWSSYETLKTPGEMKLMMKFYLCLHNFSDLFSRVPMGNCFWCYFRQLFISLAFRKCIKDFHILIIILVQDMCPLKTEIARFPIGFCLKLLNPDVSMYILHTVLHTFSTVVMRRIYWTIKTFVTCWRIPFFPQPYVWAVLLKGEIKHWSLLRVKG